ncbi:hypothetical protein F2P56_034172 [Juglans regia]|uniref:Uncharacterized protein LOC108991629 n=2 Tax=Juglans regia TaxID=51240 RepID=A0A2I4EQ26_JUGRE|nr:uncharacterized protein LOC108991629 [Juglans regia]KAF5445094.1 hypothetical protein F2P56_034172 [Juglans regia]
MIAKCSKPRRRLETKQETRRSGSPEQRHRASGRQNDGNRAPPKGDRDRAPIGEIWTIAGGFAGGGVSTSSRKAYTRKVRYEEVYVENKAPKQHKLGGDQEVISFGEADWEGVLYLHDDVLVITLVLTNYTTRRILIDNGSSADILFWEAFIKMGIDVGKLRPSSTPLKGFSEDTIQPIGAITLPDSDIHIPPQDKVPNRKRVGESQGEQALARECYVQELRKGQSKSHEELPGIDNDIIEHCLGVDSASKAVQQKRRPFSVEKYAAINKEVESLLASGFIKEAHYPKCLPNVVLVKKANGKWRICVDFINLNKACPKDSFPLPCIDVIVDPMAGHRMLSFMDAYSGYNQIRMHVSNEEKNSFITDRGLYCYRVMPFGLKNAGATYQRLVNRMFKE